MSPNRSVDWDWELTVYAFTMCIGGLAMILLLPRFVLEPPAPALSDPAELECLKSQAAAMIEAIEAHRSAHGRCPDSLDRLGLAFPETRFGPWRYEVVRGGEHYHLKVGDYDRNGFRIDYRSTMNDWVIDR